MPRTRNSRAPLMALPISQEQRVRALELAIECRPGNESIDGILARADRFANFIAQGSIPPQENPDRGQLA